MDIYLQYFFLSCMVTRQQIYSVHFNYFPCTCCFQPNPSCTVLTVDQIHLLMENFGL